MGEDAVRRGLDWIAGMQSANGGWGAFDADNSSYWLYKLPFCDFGYVIDPPSEDVSAHALEALAPEPRYADPVARGLDYLVREQQWDGSWWGRWGVNHVYGTGAVLPALEACGFEPSHPAIRKAVAVAGLGAARGRRLRRGHPLVPRDGSMRGRGDADRFTNGLGVTRLRCRRRGARARRPAGPPTIFARSKRRTETGASATTPEPASPPIS